jgi:hypothetical protein
MPIKQNEKEHKKQMKSKKLSDESQEVNGVRT